MTPDKIQAIGDDIKSMLKYGTFSAQYIAQVKIESYQDTLTDANGDDCGAHVRFCAVLANALHQHGRLGVSWSCGMVAAEFNKLAQERDDRDKEGTAPLILDVSGPAVLSQATTGKF